MRLDKMLGIKYPFIQGGMANIATGEFAAAVSNAGGLGLIGAGGMNTDMLRENIRKCRTLTDKPFGVNLMLMNPEADAMAELLVEENVKIVTTGYGRAYINSGDDSITEITCHAKGAHYLNPNVRTVIDIGGQDIKAISIDENGAVKNFLMNDKCAAGTGRFLEMMARTLGLSLEEMSTMGPVSYTHLTLPTKA